MYKLICKRNVEFYNRRFSRLSDDRRKKTENYKWVVGKETVS